MNGRALAAAGLLVLLTGCGFQLRSAWQAPPALARLQVVCADRHSPLQAELLTLLRQSGVEVSTSTDASSATPLPRLGILAESSHQRTLARGPDGLAREYEIVYEARVGLTAADGRVLLAPETLTVSRELVQDEARVLGRAEGERRIRSEMIRDAAWTVLRRLQALNPAAS